MILSWHRQNSAEFGIARATWWLWSVAWRRAWVQLNNRLLPARYECPCCGWTGRRFLDYVELGYIAPNAACPRCDSHSRHRALFLWLKNNYCLANRTGVALIVAPERSLAPLWAEAKDLRVYKLDIGPGRDVDVMADVARLPFTSGAADLIWCHHVLEQVEDDRAAMREFHRALKMSSGELIISAGMNSPDVTREFGFSDKTLSGNRRAYGKDFPQRLEEAGFGVEALTSGLTGEDCRRFGINPEVFYCCTKKAESPSHEAADLSEAAVV